VPSTLATLRANGVRLARWRTFPGVRSLAKHDHSQSPARQNLICTLNDLGV
jgi:hypothetical protein